MRRSRLCSRFFHLLPLLAVSLGHPLVAQGGESAQGVQSQPPFVETIEVREVELQVDLSALPTFEAIGKKDLEDFIVVEDGIAYPLTEMSAKAEANWIFVLYFDSVLAGPEERSRAAIELAAEAEKLTAGGLAEIVVADPLPHTVLTTADAGALRHQLDELARTASREDTPAQRPLSAGSAARLAQLDRLTIELAARGGGGARGLLLPVGAWPLDPEGLARLTTSKSATTVEAPEFQPLREAAKALAGYGWVTLPLALRAPSEVTEPSAAEKRTQVSMGGSGDRRTTVPIITVSGNEGGNDPATAAQVATLTDFSLMPYGELARTTSGALIGERGRLQATLRDLTGRRKFTYRSPFPQPGRLMPLEVRWKGGDGRTLAAPRWLRSATPPEVTAARLRRLLAGDAAPTTPSSGIQWNPDSGRVCFPGDGEKRWVRLSTATEKGGAIQVTTGEPSQIERTAAGLCVEAPAVSGARSARLVEDLEGDSWSGAVSASN